MPISLVRIDDRLIHGQVVESWIPSLSIARVIVVSDEAAADETQAALMRLAMPDSSALEIATGAQAPAAVRRAAAAPENTLVLAPGPAEVLALLKAGILFSAVNVGGLHYAAGRVQLGKALFLDEEDQDALEAIAGRGVRLEGRAVPSDSPTDVAAMLRARPA